MKTIYTFSSLRTFQTCPMLYFYKYILGYRPVIIEVYLSFGKAFHQFLEDPTKEVELENAFENAKLQALIQGYKNRYQDIIDIPYISHRSEIIFEIDIKQNKTAKIAGKFDDLIFVDLSNDVLVEHKTSVEDIQLGSVYWQKLQIDMQVGLYWLAMLTMHYRPKYILYNVIGKPLLQPLLATPPENRKYKKDGSLYKNQREYNETPEDYYNRICTDIIRNPDKYFQRATVQLLKENLLAIKSDILSTIEHIEYCSKTNTWPRHTGNCIKFKKPCRFFPVCTEETNLNNIERYYQSDVLHPELQEENNNND